MSLTKSISGTCNDTDFTSGCERGGMRTYIAPIGYDSTRVTRPVLSRGLDNDDMVVLLRPATETDDNRATGAITDVERMLEEIEPDVTTTVERISHDDFPAATIACSDLIRAADGEIVAVLGGGARDVLLPFVIATLVHTPLLDTVLTFSDIDGQVREWNLPALTADVPAKTRATLATIAQAENEISIPDLTDQTGQAKSTVTRHVQRLDENEVVSTWTDGKTKYVRVSLTGRLLLRSENSENSTRN